MARVASCWALVLIAAASPLGAQSAPGSGQDVLQRMHAAYAGKWYQTLTFVQRTTNHRGDTTTVATWYETIGSPSSLRIDIDSATSGSGVIYTADSSYAVRGGTVAAARAGGNPFLPLIQAVYTQPVERTVRDLAQYKFDLTRVRAGTWEGRPVWIVGSTGASDTTSMQFWVDTERLILVRMIVAFGDVHLQRLERVGGGWLATRVEFYRGGVLRTVEEYRDWKADPPISPALFDPGKWTTAPHWAAKK